MPLESGHKVAIWSIEDKGTYSKASLSSAKKDKDGKYQTDWSNAYCTLFDKAYEAVKGINFTKDENKRIDARIGWGYDRSNNKGQTYKQAPFSVSNNYDKSKGILYTNYAIFDLEVIKSNKSDSNDTEQVQEQKPVEEANPFEQNVTKEETTSQNTQNGLVGLDFLNIPDGFGDNLPFK